MKARGWIATTIVGAACAATAAVLVHKAARSADHLDSPSTVADPTVDIDDLYSWMDGPKFVAAMTVYPNAPAASDGGVGAMFSDSAQYVFHTASGSGYGGTNEGYDIICTFSGTTPPQTTECWAGTDEHVKGDASGTSGLASADGKLKVFAGLRADPFFFNLAGFQQAVADVEGASGLTFNDAGCPTNAPASVLAAQLSHAPDGGAPSDFFANFNALAIVVSIDKSLVTAGGPVVSVWASTHK